MKQGPGQPPKSEAALLRQLVQEKREEKQQEAQKSAELGSALDQLWRKKRADLSPRLIEAGKGEILRRARDVANRGEVQLQIDLGVDEKRLRAASPTAPLNLADAVLSEKGAADPGWAYLGRVGWMLQTPDGKALNEVGHAFIRELQQMGLTARFTPFVIQDNPSDPFHNAALHLTW